MTKQSQGVAHSDERRGYGVSGQPVRLMGLTVVLGTEPFRFPTRWAAAEAFGAIVVREEALTSAPVRVAS